MSLKITQRRFYPLDIIRLVAVFLAFFSLSYTIGSLSFTVNESSADTVIDPTAPQNLTLSVKSSDLNLATKSSSADAEASSDINIFSDTNNIAGLSITMSVAGPNTGLSHDSSVATIPSTTNLSPAALTSNTWGYNLGSGATTFTRLPGIGKHDTLALTNTPSTDMTTTITVGAKLDPTRPSGSYGGTIRITALTNYVPPAKAN